MCCVTMAGAKIEDELWKMRLDIMQEKLKLGKDRVKAYDNMLEGQHRHPQNDRSPRERKVDREVRALKRRQRELKDMISHERMLNALQRSPYNAWNDRPPDPSKASDLGKKDRFEQVMEMMLLQHTQTQNMIMNQMLLDNNKPRASPPAPQPPPPVTLPPIYPPLPYLYPPYPLPLPHQQPEPRPSTQSTIQPRTSHKPKPRPHTAHYSFPGNDSQRKIRQLGYAAIFCSHLQKQSKRNNFRPQVGFLFELKLKEIISALHRIYLASDGQTNQILRSSVFGDNSYDFRILIDPSAKPNSEDQKKTVQAFAFVIENLVYHITEIMPAKGVLGTHRKAMVFELIRSDQKFPDDYFYALEKALLSIGQDNRTKNVSDEDAAMLLLGIFLDRALITSLLMKPEQYRLVSKLDQKFDANSRLVASVLFYIYRRLLANLSAGKAGLKKGSKINMPPSPTELSSWLHSDDIILPLTKKLKKSIDYTEGLSLPWCQEYIRRLRNAAF